MVKGHRETRSIWLALALVLAVRVDLVEAQEEELLPSLLPGTAGVETGVTSLGRTPGAGGPLIENAPGAGEPLLGGRPGPAFPRVPATITTPGVGYYCFVGWEFLHRIEGG